MMRKPDTILDEIHAARQKIDERTQGMTAAERTAYFNRRGKLAAAKFGFKIAANAEDKNNTACKQYK